MRPKAVGPRRDAISRRSEAEPRFVRPGENGDSVKGAGRVGLLRRLQPFSRTCAGGVFSTVPR